MNNICLESRLPSVEEFKTLRVSVGWGLPSDAAIRRGLAGSTYGVCAVDDGVVVATGRIVGDGGFYFVIADLMVSPHYRSLGIGTAVMDRLLSYIRSEAGPGAMITLMAAQGVESYYERFGFVRRPSAEYGAGMMVPESTLAEWLGE